MSTSVRLEAAITDFLAAGLYDWNDQYMLFSSILDRYDLEHDEWPRARDLTLQALEQMLDRGLIEIGDLHVPPEGLDEFQPWTLSRAGTLARIRDTWKPGIPRTPWEVCCIVNTPSGDEWARRNTP